MAALSLRAQRSNLNIPPLPTRFFYMSYTSSWSHSFIIIFALFENFAVQYLLLGALAPWWLILSAPPQAVFNPAVPVGGFKSFLIRTIR
jgi:hypothetical protein